MTEGNVEEFEAATAGEAAMRALAEPRRIVTLDRLAAGRSDFFGDDYEVSESDQAQMAKHLARIADHIDQRPGAGRRWLDRRQPRVREAVGLRRRRHPDPRAARLRTAADALVPAAHGDWLAAHIPGATTRVTDDGHMGDDDTVEGDMAWLAGRA